MAKAPQTTGERKSRQILGISLSPEMAAAVKEEADRRGVSLRYLFEELWNTYTSTKK